MCMCIFWVVKQDMKRRWMVKEPGRRNLQRTSECFEQRGGRVYFSGFNLLQYVRLQMSFSCQVFDGLAVRDPPGLNHLRERHVRMIMKVGLLCNLPSSDSGINISRNQLLIHIFPQWKMIDEIRYITGCPLCPIQRGEVYARNRHSRNYRRRRRSSAT